MTDKPGNLKLLKPEQHQVLAGVLGDTPETLQSVHMLRRGSCKAYVAGDPARFEGAIVQGIDWPEEPTGFGSDPKVLWALLRLVEGWNCILVPSECAPTLAIILEAEMGCRTRFLDDIAHVLTRPVRVFRDAAVMRLTLTDLQRLESAPQELRAGLWGSPRELLVEGSIACALVSGEIVASALTAACTDQYAEIGVYTQEAYRGRGYATAAASMVTRAAQEEGLIPVWSAGAHNSASLRVARKLGFEEVSRRTYVILERH